MNSQHPVGGDPVLLCHPEAVGNVNPLDNQYPALQLDLTTYVPIDVFRSQRNPARFQRASKGAGESATRRRDDVVYGRRVWLIPLHRVEPVVSGDGPVDPEGGVLRVSGKTHRPVRSLPATNGGFANVDWLWHTSLPISVAPVPSIIILPSYDTPTACFRLRDGWTGPVGLLRRHRSQH
jgi:hypothetical protein